MINKTTLWALWKKFYDSCLYFRYQVLNSFCQSAYLWLKEDIENVVVVHCEAGMARAGMMISSLSSVLEGKIHTMFLNDVTMSFVEISITFLFHL